MPHKFPPEHLGPSTKKGEFSRFPRSADEAPNKLKEVEKLENNTKNSVNQASFRLGANASCLLNPKRTAGL